MHTKKRNMCGKWSAVCYHQRNSTFRSQSNKLESQKNKHRVIDKRMNHDSDSVQLQKKKEANNKNLQSPDVQNIGKALCHVILPPQLLHLVSINVHKIHRFVCRYLSCTSISCTVCWFAYVCIKYVSEPVALCSCKNVSVIMRAAVLQQTNEADVTETMT